VVAQGFTDLQEGSHIVAGESYARRALVGGTGDLIEIAAYGGELAGGLPKRAKFSLRQRG
jgi:hypothetical protein